WCTWEQYKSNIDEAVLLRALDGIEASDLPVRYVLVDDGHHDFHDQKLRSFEANAAKFPNGWGPILARRRDDGVRWFGLWLNFTGYWHGVAEDHALDDLREHLAPVAQ